MCVCMHVCKYVCTHRSHVWWVHTRVYLCVACLVWVCAYVGISTLPPFICAPLRKSRELPPEGKFDHNEPCLNSSNIASRSPRAKCLPHSARSLNSSQLARQCMASAPGSHDTDSFLPVFFLKIVSASCPTKSAARTQCADELYFPALRPLLWDCFPPPASPGRCSSAT